MKHKLNKSPEEVVEQSKNMLHTLENLPMMLNGLVKMEHEPIWILCARQLNLQLSVEPKQ